MWINTYVKEASKTTTTQGSDRFGDRCSLLLFTVPSCGRNSMANTLREPRSGEESDATMSVAMALSEYKHHTSRGQNMDRAGRGVRDAVHGQVPEALLPQEPGTQHFTLDDDDSVPELGYSRPQHLPHQT